MKFKFLISIALFSLVLFAACRPAANQNADRNANLIIDSLPDASRIVTIGTAITETVDALGIGGKIVGVDNSSAEYLPQYGKLPKVGARNALNAEGILSLKPTFVILTADAAPQQAIEQLKSAGVTTFVQSADMSVESVKAKVRNIAEALGIKAKGDAINAQIDREIAEVNRTLANLKEKPKVLFVGRGPNMPNATMSGAGTTIDEMIRLAGGTNPMSNFTGFKEMTDEAVGSAAPDIILMTDRSFERAGGVEGVLKFPGILLTPAGKNHRIVHVSDMYFQGFGPGVGKAVRELARQFHPELSAETNANNLSANQAGK